ncbi:hypothetical protein [Nocardiopsis oceani]
MSTATIPLDLRRVLDAPRGRRFSRTPHTPGNRPGRRPDPRPDARPDPRASTGAGPEPLPPLASLGRTPRERELLARMPDTPRLRRRFTHGDLPEWMRSPPPPSSESCWRQDRHPDLAPEPEPAPRPAREPGRGTEPARPVPVPRPRRESVPPAPLPRRPASHRKPRRRVGHLVTGYAFAVAAGAVGQHLLAFLA